MYDKIIIGAGLYGLYAATVCGKRKEKVLVLEADPAAFMRATYINQARVHMGYHYPRSISTALKSAKYFERFNEEYGFCIHSRFDQIYATSSDFSWTNAGQFEKFCHDSGIMCKNIQVGQYFNDKACDGAFLTREYTYDAQMLKDFFLKEISRFSNVEVIYNARVTGIEKASTHYILRTNNGRGEAYKGDFILNATYASVNQILNMLDYSTFKIKYELCEIILCDVNEKLQNVGITVMDGPFFSIMPFGKTGMHSLTSVTFTPHMSSYNSLPIFGCQLKSNGYCSEKSLGNCNDCIAKPKTAWCYMKNLAKKYLKDEFGFTYKESLFSMKPILKASEIDDSRPTVIKYFSKDPVFVSVLSGKINTVYDLDEVLK